MTTCLLPQSSSTLSTSLGGEPSEAEKLKAVAIKAFNALLAGQPVTLTTGTLLAKVYYDDEEISVEDFTNLLQTKQIAFVTKEKTANSNYYLQRPPPLPTTKFKY